mmetsp:Transcript_14883/g.41837  ORF Transcript_14883/g.41837 Transcript_14883/m.41837 type:complete len:276 (+) Transcript_14883:172-999(+)|eukprot:CAMPEP_0117680430 /NCGR_PEP_ID=MMETSP0804-20121206/18349_1 /TAXON_ID=1074897 /ORGANISM="Tetraselmis astigmatica, Strain CCMP880" /LENGTH=275 /DNA_ID=CAMNT_0005489929 /DNA_START=109 /DNA_END=936 /DNA_ORIENTATION=+
MKQSWFAFAFVTASAAAISYATLRKKWKNGADEEASTSRIAKWLDRWQKGQTQFHQQEPNSLLVKHADAFLEPSTTPMRVFVPFCGKSVDLPWLASHSTIAEVVGNEAVELAVQQFVSDNPSLGFQEPEVVRGTTADAPAFVIHRSTANVTLIQGDHFLLGPSTLGAVDLIWDRAALVAANPAHREGYVAVLREALKPGGKILLTTLDRAAGLQSARELGPPFSVTEKDVGSLFGGWCRLEKLDRIERINQDDHEKFRNQGLTSLLEECYLLTKM